MNGVVLFLSGEEIYERFFKKFERKDGSKGGNIMKTKLVAILIAIALCAYLFVGCNGEPEAGENVSKSSSFVIVENAYGYNVVYHKDTKVMYTYSTSGYNYGNFCLLVNPDGTPMIWEGE